MPIIEDDFGKPYEVNDLVRFKKHLEEYHSVKGKGDNSVHEENGYWFTVTATFYDRIMALEV